MPEPTLRTRPRRARTRAVALLAATLAVFGGSVALAPAAMAATDVTITAPATVTAGDTVEVSIAADAGADLFAYDLAVSYDPALLSYTADSETFPAGGFGAVTGSAGDVTFTHTRLGTSPGLAGAQTLVTFSFTALAEGSATITLTAATFIDSADATQPLAAPVSATVEIDAASVAPSPAPSTPAPSQPAPGDPDNGAADPDPAGDADGSLAVTGDNATGWIIAAAVAAALLALGTVLLVRRRRAEVAR